MIVDLNITGSPVAEVRTISKYSAITMSDGYYYAAENALNDICYELTFMPKIASRERMKVIVRDLIVTIRSDPIEKVYTTALDLIADISIDMIEEYFKIKSLFIEAQYNIELAHFYEQLSLHCRDIHIENHPGTVYFESAINYITHADIAAAFIRDKELQRSLSHYLKRMRQILYEEFNKDVRQLSDIAWMHYENLPEVLSEIYENDADLAEIVDEYFLMAGIALEKSEAQFGIKNDKNFFYYFNSGITPPNPTKKLLKMIRDRTHSEWEPHICGQRVRTGGK